MTDPIINKASHSGKLDIYIWGAGHYGLLTAFELKRKALKIKGFIDMQAKKLKTKAGLPIYEPDEILSAKKRNFKIIIAVQDAGAIREITGILLQAGLKERKDFEISYLIEGISPLNSINIADLTSYDTDVKKEMKNPLARIIVVTYNHLRFIRHCLNGILMQRTNFSFEIYVYDDCSTDGTSDIIREYAKKYPNIIADIQPENYYSKDRGLQLKILALNWKNHKCKYVAVTDGDDYWTDPYKLQIQVDFLEKNSDFSMCSGGWIINDDFSGNQQVCMVNSGNSIGFEYDFYTAHGGTHYLIKNFTRIYRTSTIPEYETSAKYKYFRDVHLAYYVLTKGKGYFFSRIFGIYNKYQGGIFGGLSPHEQREINYKVYEEIYRETQDEQIKNNFLSNSLEDILQRFRKETSLHREPYDYIIKNAKRQNIRFSAQFAQDIMAYLFFHGKKNGFYIEIGANDGYSGSTTFWAQQLDWKGICVEPQKETFERLQEYRNCALYNFAISDKTQRNVKFITFPERDFRSGIAGTMSASHIEEAKKLSSMSTTTINTITFGDMMKDFPNVKHIDFLSIDTEGHEINVLRSIDFDKYSFGLITIETKENSDVVKFVKQKGYKPLLTAGSDVVFVPKNYRAHLGKLLKPKRDMLKFEVHLCDHCNLNCKHCGHFSPIADKKFVDLDILERDFKRLSMLTDGKCETIDLMGGEPLLHPKITEIFDIARKYFCTKIQLVTNGILLASQPDEFWESCRKNCITIAISIYPIQINEEKIKAQASKFGITLVPRLKFGEKNWFKGSPDFTGSQNIEIAYRTCKYGSSCLFLENGKLAHCALPLLSKYFNKYFDKSKYKFDEPTEEDFIDIFKINSLDEILEKLTRPIPYCRYCKHDSVKYVKWGLSKKKIQEWT
jgi:FkbM family methyltransferase